MKARETVVVRRVNSYRILSVSIASVVTACASLSAAPDVAAGSTVRVEGTAEPVPGALVVYVWRHRQPGLGDAGPNICDRVEVRSSAADGTFLPPRATGLGSPVVHTIYKQGFADGGEDETSSMMKPVERGSPVRLSQILRTANGLTCPYPVLRDALDYFIAVREEASALASTPWEKRSVAALSMKIEDLRDGRDGPRLNAPVEVPK